MHEIFDCLSNALCALSQIHRRENERWQGNNKIRPSFLISKSITTVS